MTTKIEKQKDGPWRDVTINTWILFLLLFFFFLFFTQKHHNAHIFFHCKDKIVCWLLWCSHFLAAWNLNKGAFC